MSTDFHHAEPNGRLSGLDAIEAHRDDLEYLAQRDDLNSAKYARAMLKALDSGR